MELVLGQLQKKREIKKIGSFRDARYMRICFMTKILFVCYTVYTIMQTDMRGLMLKSLNLQ